MCQPVIGRTRHRNLPGLAGNTYFFTTHTKSTSTNVSQARQFDKRVACLVNTRGVRFAGMSGIVAIQGRLTMYTSGCIVAEPDANFTLFVGYFDFDALESAQ